MRRLPGESNTAPSSLHPVLGNCWLLCQVYSSSSSGWHLCIQTSVHTSPPQKTRPPTLPPVSPSQPLAIMPPFLISLQTWLLCEVTLLLFSSSFLSPKCPVHCKHCYRSRVYFTHYCNLPPTPPRTRPDT